MKNNTERYLAPQCEVIQVRLEMPFMGPSLLVSGGSSTTEVYDTDEI